MATVAKFPSAALADFGGELPGFPEATLSGAHNNSTPTITLTATVPTAWPNIGWVTIDSEIIKYAAKSGATLTGCTRGDQSAYGGSAAASHLDQAKVGFYLTPQVVNQIIAEIIAMQTSVSNPNLCLNSDFGRRTVFGLAMPEVFADTNGYTQLDGGAAPTVSANILTNGAASNSLVWPKVGYATFWRDGRASATFKATSTTGIYELFFHLVDQNNVIRAMFDGGGNFVLQKVLAGTPTTVGTVAQALTLNRWYWLEIDAQGTTYTAKVYDTGGTASGVTKASSTLLQTLSGTIADASIQLGGIGVRNNQAAGQWGGIATGNGGVYVETWLPESFDWTPATVFGGTLGGQAVGYDESANAGPGLGTSANGKQWAIRAYIPATSRTITLQQFTADGAAPAGASVAFSGYLKTSGKGGSGDLVRWNYKGATGGAGTGTATITLADAAEASWTRKSGTVASDAAATQARIQVLVNPTSTATGTSWVSCAQLEQGSAATAWRNAPADDAPLAITLSRTVANTTTTSLTFVEPDPRDLACNLFLPWDATVEIQANATMQNSIATDGSVSGASVDGTGSVFGQITSATASADVFHAGRQKFKLAAGKHRISLVYAALTGGTALMRADATFHDQLQITAYRGK